jgi:hypothetical protein
MVRDACDRVSQAVRPSTFIPTVPALCGALAGLATLTSMVYTSQRMGHGGRIPSSIGLCHLVNSCLPLLPISTICPQGPRPHVQVDSRPLWFRVRDGCRGRLHSRR